MLIKNLKIKGLLSFGPEGIDLDLQNLNVLIGPNGSGKSNLLEALALLKSAPANLPGPVKEMGGVKEWLWKSTPSLPQATIEATLDCPLGKQPIRHGLSIADHGGRFEVVDEWIENEKPYPRETNPNFYYRFERGNPVLNEFQKHERRLKRESIRPEESILSQVRDPEHYPVLAWLQEQYPGIRLFRNWTFGPGATLRREKSTHNQSDFLEDGGENLALVLSQIKLDIKEELIPSLNELYEGISDVGFQIGEGNVMLFLLEKGGRKIPATRLSDGTLRYLCLLSILLHPNPPPLICIEEPELGLHPDVIFHVGQLIQRASKRTQLIITTHSRMLIDSLKETPESIVVCENGPTGSSFERLDSRSLAQWLDRYSLGDLWSMGKIGGNRW